MGNIVISGGQPACFPEYEPRPECFQPSMFGKLCGTGLFANSGDGDPEFSVCLHRVLLSAPGNKAVDLPALLLEHAHVVGAALGIVCNPSVLDAVSFALFVKLGQVNGG